MSVETGISENEDKAIDNPKETSTEENKVEEDVEMSEENKSEDTNQDKTTEKVGEKLDVDTDQVQDQEELDYEPAKDDNKDADDEVMKDTEEVQEVEPEEEDYGYEIEGDLKKLRCIHCEFLKFKNIDEWKNHFIGHWRLEGMKGAKVQCFVKGCLYSPAAVTYIDDRLSKLGQHFVDVHKFQQAAYRKCDICNVDFYEERKYNAHMKKHDPSFTCDLCKKKITGKLWFRKHIEKCYGDERPTWARKPVEVKPGEDKEVLEIYGKEYDVRWGEVTNTFTKKTRIAARAWIEGKGWVGKGDTRDDARNQLIKALKNHIKKTMDKGLYTLEDGEIVPEPTLSETPAPPTTPKKSSCPQCGTQFSKRANLELHMFMHRNDGKTH